MYKRPRPISYGMKVLKISIFIICLIALATLIFFSSYEEGPSYVKIGDKVVYVDIADTSAKMAKGLSGRQSLNGDQGMLFVFTKPDFYIFWMKDMLFPIDIVWIDENFMVVYVEQRVEPNTFSKTFTSKIKAFYVLELQAGFAEDNNLKVGDFI